MTIEVTRAQQAELSATIERLTSARQEAASALDTLAPQLEALMAELGRAGLAARLGQGKAADVTRLGTQVADLERRRAEYVAVIAEAGRQTVTAEAELSRLQLREKRMLYADALAERDEQLTAVLGVIEQLKPQLDALWKLETAAATLAGEADVSGHSYQFRDRIGEVLTRMLGTAYVPAGRHWDLTSMIVRQRERAQQLLEEDTAA